MSECTTYWLRDNEPVDRISWKELLSSDVRAEAEQIGTDSEHWKLVCNDDLDEGREVEVNGHTYVMMTEFAYSSPKELLEDILDNGDMDAIKTVLLSISEDQLQPLLLKLDNVMLKDGNLVVHYY